MVMTIVVSNERIERIEYRYGSQDFRTLWTVVFDVSASWSVIARVSSWLTWMNSIRDAR